MPLVIRTDDAYLYQSLGYALGVPWISPSMLLFSMACRNKINKPLVALSHLWAISAMLPMALFPRLVSAFQDYSWGRYPYYRPDTSWSIPYGIYVGVFLLFFGFLSLKNFYQGWRTAVSPRERRQFRNMTISLLLAYTGSVDFLTGLRIPIYPFGYIGLTIFVLIVAYTITRHQFFEINILLRRFSAIFLIYAILIAGTVPLVLAMLKKNVALLNANTALPFVGLSVFVGVMLSLGPLIYAYLLRHTYWLKGHMSTGLAHELKSPLGSIQSSLEILMNEESKKAPNRAKVFEYLHLIQRNAERMELFTNDLLKAAQIQENTFVIEKSMTDLQPLTEEIIQQHRPIADGKKISIHFKAGEIPLLEVDAKKIQQVMSNILSNALKYTEKGAVNVTLRKEADRVICQTQDSGRGLPPSEIEKIFERFYQGKHRVKGAGLGLAIAKAWVEAHGGKIWAESEGEGKGTTISFTLPI